MHLVVFGGNGQTGRLVVRQALEAGHTVVAVTRRPADFPITHSQLTIADADVRDSSSLPGVIEGADAVVSTLGVRCR